MIIREAFHIVITSPWPILSSLRGLRLAVRLLVWFRTGRLEDIQLSILFIVIIIFNWWRDVIREGLSGFHTSNVQTLLRNGIILFIVREVMFFFAFFWAYFHSSLSPTPVLGNIWPPVGCEVLDAIGFPLFGTCLLLISRAIVTFGHHALILTHEEWFSNTPIYYIRFAGHFPSIAFSDKCFHYTIGEYEKEGYQRMDKIWFCNWAYFWALQGILGGIFLGILFLGVQWIEYRCTTYHINRSVYGSIFFFATGFHGLHVLLGVVFLRVRSYRCLKSHFSNKDHVGMEGAIWYWHFVDVVWLFFVFKYLLVRKFKRGDIISNINIFKF
jgi:heme/copper-type cytochrome/quinol oxidase subunit 3